MMRSVAIIGAGCSGLTAIKACLEEHLQPVCFEKENDIGGLWNYNDEPKIGKGSVYKSTVINTSKEMMAFSDFPPPSDFPTFAPHHYVLKYFRLYAENFGLIQFIKFRTVVLRIKQADDYEDTGKWTITYKSDTDKPKTETFDAVMICTGHHTYPHLPMYPGQKLYKGKIIHSHSYRHSSQYTQKRVLVVGIGNSAVDLAVDLCKDAKQVYLSTRRGAWVISRKGVFGIPADAIANNRILFSFPKVFLNWAVQFFANLHCNHAVFGLKPRHRGLEAHPTINDDLPVKMMSSQIILKPDIHHFTETAVWFDNTECVEVDSVIFATGYDYKFSFLDDRVTKLNSNEVHLYKYMYPPQLPHATLAVIGLIQVIGAVMPISEIQCRWFTRILKGKHDLPKKEVMEKDIKFKRQANSDYVQTQRHTIQSFWIQYMDEIAKEIGVKPNIPRLLYSDPTLALHCLFGPCIPAQYRLMGPGKWDGAKQCVQTASKRNVSALTAHSFPLNKNGDSTIKFIFNSNTKSIIVCALFVGIIWMIVHFAYQF